MAQHIVKLSTASLSNSEGRLLVEKSCSFLRFLLLSQVQILLSTEQKALWLNPVSCGMLGPAVLKCHSGLWQGEKQEDLVLHVERNQAKKNICNQVYLCISQRCQVIFCLTLQFRPGRCLQFSTASKPSWGLWSVSKPNSSSVTSKTLQSDSSVVLKVAVKQSTS